MTKKKGDEIAIAEETAIEEYDYGTDAGAGREGQTTADYIVPFLNILQSGSPPCVEGRHKPGQIYNTVSEHAYDEVTFVPVSTERKFMEWKPRSAGGGLVGPHDPDEEVVIQAQRESVRFGQYATPDGNDLVETFYMHVLILDGPDAGNGAILPFASTKIQPYKRWNSKCGAFKLPNGQPPPLFAHVTKLTTVPQKNDQGAFWNIVLSPANDEVKNSLLPPGDDRLDAAKKFRELVKSGATKVDYSAEKASSPAGDPGDKDIPF